MYFNPRTHVGCDDTENPDNVIGKDFNPRTHVGCDDAAEHHPDGL